MTKISAVSASLFNAADYKRHHGCSTIPRTAVTAAAGGHHPDSAWFKRIPNGVRDQQHSDEAHHGGIQLLHGISGAADC